MLFYLLISYKYITKSVLNKYMSNENVTMVSKFIKHFLHKLLQHFWWIDLFCSWPVLYEQLASASEANYHKIKDNEYDIYVKTITGKILTVYNIKKKLRSEILTYTFKLKAKGAITI